MVIRPSSTCMTIEKVDKTTATVIACHCGSRTTGLDLAELLFDFCSNCGCSFADMSTVGHGAFAVCKVRQNNEKALTKIQAMEHEKEKFYDQRHNMEPTPMKYNSKMMNSIWGMYNRYSVHNLKKNMDDKVGGMVAANQQMPSVGAAATMPNERGCGDSKTAKSPQLFPKFWSPFNNYY